MVISEEQQARNQALKEQLLRKRAFRRFPVESPLDKLAAAEQRITEESKVRPTFLSRFSKGWSASRPYLGAAARGTARLAGGTTKLIVKGGATAVGAAARVASSTPEKIKNSDPDSNPGLVLALAGFAVFIFDLVFKIDNFWLALIIASFFMLYSSLMIFKGEGIIITVLFLVTYVYLIGTLNLSIEVILKYYALPLILIGMLLHGLVRKIGRTGTFGEGFIGEIKGAIPPVLLFLLDLGLIEIVTGLFKVPVSILNIDFLRFIPWWGLMGLAYTNSNKHWVAVAKVLAMLYVVTIVFIGIGVPSSVYAYQKSFVAGPQELFQARLEAKKEVKPELPFASYATCFVTGRFAELDVCVKEEQRKSLAERICKNIGITSGSELDQCVKDELAKIDRGGAKGTTDLLRKEFLKAKFEPVKDNFPKVVYEPKKSYPATLLIENPLQQPIGIEVKCKFTRGSLEILGEVSIKGEPTPSYLTNFKEDPVRIGCRPSQNLDGSHNLEIEATLTNIITTSTLTRVFVKSQQDKERWEAEIKSTAIAGFDAGLSSSADEFARLNFAFGNFPEDPIILSDKPVVFTASIEDQGRGRLSRIRSYILPRLEEKGFIPTSGDQYCLQRGEVVIPSKVRNYNLAECFLELPAEYKQFELPYIVDTFEAKLVYDYTLIQKIPGLRVEKT